MTVRQMLQHVSGMPQNLIDDPTFRPISNQAADAFRVPRPAAAEYLVRYTQTIAPKFSPGANYDYSNIGFTALGRMTEKVSGKLYEQFLREEIFAPLGVTRLPIGKTRLSERFPGEVRYHMRLVEPLVQGVYASDGMVERPDGAFYLKGLAGAAGWVGTTVDLLRIISRLNQTVSPAEITRRPAPPVTFGAANYCGLGFHAQTAGDTTTLFHIGSLAGFRSYFIRIPNDVCLAYTINMRPADEAAFGAEAQTAYVEYIRGSRPWPQHDLFPLYHPGERPRLVEGGIVSAASFKPVAVSPGLIVTLFGDNLGPSQLTTAQIDPATNRLSTAIGGTRVLFDGTPAPFVYTFSSQLSAIVPYTVAGKSNVRVAVERLGVTPAPADGALTLTQPLPHPA